MKTVPPMQKPPRTSTELPSLPGTLTCLDVYLVRDLADDCVPNDYEKIGSRGAHEEPLTIDLFTNFDVSPDVQFSLLGLLPS
ncbi:hypothetical protein HYDPIDRAFT_117199 [Hydnomerulius pinastri MD-312]|uniref:Uncharacterized protein n=1 Tax=Hydnomerulius pinastri MD-312 TaxID=994086 RepID=A0A0C9W310_9AGAM|nr:hypothetical protein HYDPIDRAFT_117199 [Hydnomerulius pinastri MD-312]